MAGIRRGQGRPIVTAAVLLGALWLVIFSCPFAGAQSLYDRPVLITDLGMHTAPIEATEGYAGRFVVTGSDDKTVRIWSVADGKLQQTIHIPIGPGNASARSMPLL